MLTIAFFFQGYGDHRDLHSFPTRRSSDLQGGRVVLLALVALLGASYLYLVRFCSSCGRMHRNFKLAECARCGARSEEHTSELQSRQYLVCRLLLEKKKKNTRLDYLITTNV